MADMPTTLNMVLRTVVVNRATMGFFFTTHSCSRSGPEELNMDDCDY